MATSEQAARDTADLEDLWPDPRGRGGEGGLVLGHAVDPQERRVLVGQAEEERFGVDLDAEVAVGPAGLDGGDRRLVPPPSRHDRHHRFQVGIEAHGR
jgi:hypothetical protein